MILGGHKNDTYIPEHYDSEGNLIEEHTPYYSTTIFVPDDFTEDLYHKVADVLFAQYKDTGTVNPAKIINMFEEEEEQKEVAALFNARIHEVETQSEMEKALKETIIRVKQNSVDFRESHADPTDIGAMMKFIEERKALQQLQNLHISLN